MRWGGQVTRRFTALVIALALSALIGAPSAHASVASDQARIAAIEKEIATQGARVRVLVGRENEVQRNLQALDRQISADEQRIAADRSREEEARAELRRVSFNAYIADPTTNSVIVQMFSDTQSISSLAAVRMYLGTVGDTTANALSELQAARAAVQHDDANLHTTKSQVASAADALHKEHGAVTKAIASEQKTLAGVKQDLRQQLAAQEQAQQLAIERALAKFPWPTKEQPLPPIPPATPGSYDNPLRAIRGLNPERIDMGVDYSGYGPIYAVGDGVVLTTTVPGWPGGTMIVYQLTDGPANGLLVYAAEDIAPTVHVGDTVTANTVLGLMYLGPDGIETGWGDPNIVGNALAGDERQFDGENTTAYGANFSELLVSLGAPAGIPQNHPPTGKLPHNWPQWAPTKPAAHH
jgi:murein DD-endopeptidase MepM/ murein hydrolase activator NlpD